MLTINDLIRRTEGRGLYFVMILLCLPFISPVPVPGLSNVVGVIIVVLAVKLALKLSPGLPRILGDRKFSPNRSRKFWHGPLVMRVPAKARFFRSARWCPLRAGPDVWPREVLAGECGFIHVQVADMDKPQIRGDSSPDLRPSRRTVVSVAIILASASIALSALAS